MTVSVIKLTCPRAKDKINLPKDKITGLRIK